MTPESPNTVSTPPEQNSNSWELMHGDCFDIAPRLQPESFSLIYLDPPFFTGKVHSSPEKTNNGFRDVWQNDIVDFTDYLGARIERLIPLLTPTGSMLLHLDWHAVHYLKVRCDKLFGMQNFQNEIIWAYRSGGGTKKRYGRKHDTILWYSKGKKFCFNTDEARVPYDATIAAKRAHLFHENGKVAGDVLDISRPPNHAREWTGWPTQKPMALLDWLTRVHSKPGDLVGDFFCGSGTTLVAATNLGRRALGCDMSLDALEIANSRLRQSKLD